jgi:hypothetical protein
VSLGFTRTFVCGLGLLALCSGCATGPDANWRVPDGSREDLTRPPEPLLTEPISIYSANERTDGGTITVVLDGADGERLIFCQDNRMIPMERTEAGRRWPLHEHTSGRIFLGAGYPTKPGAQLIPYAGQLEHDVAATVRSAVRNKFGDLDIEAVRAYCDGLPSRDEATDLRPALTCEGCESQGVVLLGLLSTLEARHQAPN